MTAFAIFLFGVYLEWVGGILIWILLELGRLVTLYHLILMGHVSQGSHPGGVSVHVVICQEIKDEYLFIKACICIKVVKRCF